MEIYSKLNKELNLSGCNTILDVLLLNRLLPSIDNNEFKLSLDSKLYNIDYYTKYIDQTKTDSLKQFRKKISSIDYDFNNSNNKSYQLFIFRNILTLKCDNDSYINNSRIVKIKIDDLIYSIIIDILKNYDMEIGDYINIKNRELINDIIKTINVKVLDMISKTNINYMNTTLKDVLVNIIKTSGVILRYNDKVVDNIDYLLYGVANDKFDILTELKIHRVISDDELEQMTTVDYYDEIIRIFKDRELDKIVYDNDIPNIITVNINSNVYAILKIDTNVEIEIYVEGDIFTKYVLDYSDYKNIIDDITNVKYQIKNKTNYDIHYLNMIISLDKDNIEILDHNIYKIKLPYNLDKVIILSKIKTYKELKPLVEKTEYCYYISIYDKNNGINIHKIYSDTEEYNTIDKHITNILKEKEDEKID